MSKGTKLTPLRIPPAVLDAIDAERERSRLGRGGEVTRAAWIMSAIMEKLAHKERSNRGRAAADRLTVAQLRTSEEHRRIAYESGVAWECECEACTAAK